MMERTAYTIAFLPFFWWAVAIDERPDLPAIPFYRKAAALAIADEIKERFPGRTVVLLRRKLFRGVEVANA